MILRSCATACADTLREPRLHVGPARGPDRPFSRRRTGRMPRGRRTHGAACGRLGRFPSSGWSLHASRLSPMFACAADPHLAHNAHLRNPAAVAACHCVIGAVPDGSVLTTSQARVCKSRCAEKRRRVSLPSPWEPRPPRGLSGLLPHAGGRAGGRLQHDGTHESALQRMPRLVVTHAVGDIDRWLQDNEGRAAAIESGTGSDVTDF